MPVDHAVVLGGSISGLLAAAALSESCGRVTIVERDELPTEGPAATKSRRGVAQGDQVHHLLSLGRDKIESLLPGLDDELLELGCARYDDAADFAQYLNGGWRMRVESDLKITCFQRPVFEGAIRRRVLAKPNVSVSTGFVTGFVSAEAGRRVIGVTVREGATSRIEGDLVVDATGRSSKSAEWVEGLGFPRPVQAELRSYLGYATFLVDFGEDGLPDGLAGVTSAASSGMPRGGAIRPCGNGQHIVTAYGMIKHYPPDDLTSIYTFMDSLASPLVGKYLRRAKAVSEVKVYRMPGNQRRFWEQMPSRPEGFVVLGDATCSYNPRFGQGMTMAAIGATLLGEEVGQANGSDPGLPGRFQSRLAPWSILAFDNAVGLDSVYPEAEYRNLEPPSRDRKQYARALSDLQTEDPEILLASKRAALYLDSSLVDTPSIRSKVQDWIDEGRQVRADKRDPELIPSVVKVAHADSHA